MGRAERKNKTCVLGEETVMRKKSILVLCVIGILTFIAILFSVGFNSNPNVIGRGENKYNIGNYNLTQQGLDGFNDFIKKSADMPVNYTVAYFEAHIDKNCKVKNFTLSLDTFGSATINWTEKIRAGRIKKETKGRCPYVRKQIERTKNVQP